MDWKSTGLSSPPKPTRIAQCLIPNFVEENLCQRIEETYPREDCYEQAAGDENCTESVSLPALAGEVAEAQKQQMSDLSKKLEILEELKEKQNQVQLKINSVKDEIAAVSRKVSLIENETARKSKNCNALEKEIEELISSEGVLIKQLAIAKAELEADKETYKQYWMKMEAHAKLVELHEMNSELNQSSKKQRREGRMVEDEESLIRIGDESGVERIQAETIQLKERRKYLQEAIALTQSELQNQKEKHAQLKREADTLHKRKRAYLSRIKRHTQEAMSRQSSTMAE